jgi:hypothetical protein
MRLQSVATRRMHHASPILNLVESKHVVWRTDIEPDDIAQLGDELRITYS